MRYAVIGGTGLYDFHDFHDFIIKQKVRPGTPYGNISDEIVIGLLADYEILFLPRHGANHHIPPHRINYRANIWALMEMKVAGIISINAVGGIGAEIESGDIVVPDQIIDYTYGREHTFSDGNSDTVNHIDFTQPFDRTLRARVISALRPTDSIRYHTSGVYGCTQGPRLESAAEIQRLKNDGCSVVGMTVMPEAALAKELSIPYVSISLVANLAAGLSDEKISVEAIRKVVEHGKAAIVGIIRRVTMTSLLG